MVKHIIFFTLKADADKAAVIAAAENALMPLVGRIPGLMKMEVRKTFCGPDFVLYSEFESREALSCMPITPCMWKPKAGFSPGWRAALPRTILYKERKI